MAAEFTYAEVGATRKIDRMPDDATLVGYRRPLGGPEAFSPAADFVFGFGMQRGAGFEVSASTPTAVVGTEVRATVQYLNAVSDAVDSG